MCLLSVYSPGAMVDVDHLRNGAACNPHGYGFAIVAGDRIETGHGMTSGAVIDAFDRVRQLHPQSWALFHSRYTTDGSTTVDNCHPFRVGDDPRTVLAHNGVLPQAAWPQAADLRSDTRILAEDLIPSGRFGKLWRVRARRNLTKWMLSTNYPNKIAILTVDPRYRENAFILNEEAGDWVNGVWHSNTGYLAPRRPALSAYSWSDEPYADHGWEVSAAYRAFKSGKITYSDYLDILYTGNRPQDCQICATPGTVNVAYGYCTHCKHCADCAAHIDSCDCWSPQSTETIRAAISGDDGPPMALETSYPAVVAARKANDTDTGREHC